MNVDYETITAKDAQAMRAWFEEHAASTDGIWLKIYKKDSGIATVSRAEALDEALCFGWIDGQSKTLDDKAYLQKYTPRRARSMWSKRNIEHVERLENAGKMTDAGRAEIERAKADGRWDSAYDAPSEMSAPDYLLQALSKMPQALEFYNTLNKTNLYAIHWRLQTAKTDATRERRLQKILTMLEAGEKIHP